MNERRRLTVSGTVQGVGFRPFVYRLATEMSIGGWVINSAQGAVIEAEAPSAVLENFIERLRRELPPHAAINALESEPVSPLGDRHFDIRHSDGGGEKTALILPDLAACPDCLREMRDPSDRRYRYPFTNCTHCGPRYSIIEALPYDRANTTMHHFEMCPECRAEYEDPLDRRFHAQPTACPVCGPQLALWDAQGIVLSARDEALLMAAEALRQGQIVAVKGLGGFHLMVDARDADAVERLRRRKHRYEKPLAVMFPSLDQIEAVCHVSDAERAALTSAAAPIVLLRQTAAPSPEGRGLGVRSGDAAPPGMLSGVRAIAPGNPYLGVMLPYTPLHHLLLDELGFPVVATSGNLSGEPICTDEHEALERLGDIADLFLVHDRPIARPVDDSVVFVVEGVTTLLRRARGFAPLPVAVPGADGILATGAQQKNTVAIAHHDQVFVSQHLGDMENAASFALFERTLGDLQAMYEVKPRVIACDLHPDYSGTRYAEASGLPVEHVQHHYAHVRACMAEHNIDAPVLGITWDGTGYGTDGTIWGGEFLRVGINGSASFERFAWLRPFRLQGGDLAAREPRRCALGVLYALYGRDLAADPARERLAFSDSELKLLLSALERGVNAPQTSSMGRLFDAVAALTGLRQRCSFEGQAAMALEYAGLGVETEECYPYEVTPVTGDDSTSGYILEWNLMIQAVLQATDIGVVSARFHNTLVAMMIAVAQKAGLERVVLSGGCFQNQTLLKSALRRLRAAGFTPYWSQQIPANDGGIALGQIAAYAAAVAAAVAAQPTASERGV